MAITKKIIFFITVMFLSSVVYAADPPAAPSKDPAGSDSEVKISTPKETAPKPDFLKGPSSDMDKLKQEIQKLEEKINKMAEENDIRRRLETTAEEKSSNDEAILSAAGRDYTLMKPGNLGFEYNLTYSGDAYDNVTITNQATGKTITNMERNAFHTITNAFFIEYPVKENLTVSANIPFVYKYDSTSNSSTVKDVTDFGDTSFGCEFQPVKSGGDFPSIIMSGNLSCPTGRSPYKIDSSRELSTGNGGYAFSVGCNLSKSIDPVIAFGGINYSHPLEINNLNQKVGGEGEAGQYLYKVVPGDNYSFSMGIGYSLSYKMNLTLAYQYAYQTNSTFYWVGKGNTSTSGSISSEFSVGTGWNITPKRSMNVKVGIGLTTNDPAFTIQVRIPFTYEL